MFNSNINPDTGIRYGVINMNSIDPDVGNDLWYGPNATDVSYQGFIEEVTAEANAEYDHLLEVAEGQLQEGETVEECMERQGYSERGDYVAEYVESASDNYYCDEPHIEGTYEDVEYQITWLGGAPLLWILKGPIGFANQLCSPCVPNAADLDGGFILEGEPGEEDRYMCCVCPKDWLDQER